MDATPEPVPEPVPEPAPAPSSSVEDSCAWGTVLVTQENREKEGGALLTCVNAIRFRFGELARPRFELFRFRFGFRRTVLALAAAGATAARDKCRCRGDLNIFAEGKEKMHSPE